MYRLLVIYILLFMSLAVPSQAQSIQPADPLPPIRVQTRLIPPFVLKDSEGHLAGFSIDLWDAIATDAKLPRYEYAISPTVADLLNKVARDNADLSIAATSITAERDAKFDFSQPFFNAGLQILVPAGNGGNMDEPGNALSIDGILHNLLSPAVGKLFAALMCLAVIVAHIVWLLERNHPEGLPETKRYFPGIFKSLWWAAATLGAQADQMPKTYTARIIAVLLMFVSALSIAYFTAAVTAQITVQQLSGAIRGPDDLPGKRVATAAGSTAEEYLRENNVTVVARDTIEEAYQSLQKGQVDAVVYDAPVLLYYSAHSGQQSTRIVGPIFKKEDYGIVFPTNSPLRKRINVALLRLKENGTYDRIYNRWFGSTSGNN